MIKYILKLLMLVVLASTTSVFAQVSYAPYGAPGDFVGRLNIYMARTTGDKKAIIEQTGVSNTVTIDQIGGINQYVKLVNNGSNNSIYMAQVASAGGLNYSEITIAGNNNTFNSTQYTTRPWGGPALGIYAFVYNDNNVVNIQQSGPNGDYAGVNLTGGSKTVTINQSGTTHHARAIMSGIGAQAVSITQGGWTPLVVTVTSNCATVGGCAAITVVQ